MGKTPPAAKRPSAGQPVTATTVSPPRGPERAAAKQLILEPQTVGGTEQTPWNTREGSLAEEGRRKRTASCAKHRLTSATCGLTLFLMSEPGACALIAKGEQVVVPHEAFGLVLQQGFGSFQPDGAIVKEEAGAGGGGGWLLAC